MQPINTADYTREMENQLRSLVSGLSNIPASAAAIDILHLRLKKGLTRHILSRDHTPMCGADPADGTADLNLGPEQFDSEYATGERHFCTQCVWQLLAHGPDGPDTAHLSYDREERRYTATSPELPGRAYQHPDPAQAISDMRRDEVRAVMDTGQRHGI